MKPTVKQSGRLSWGKRACVAFVLCAMTTMSLAAQTFTTLFSFDGMNGDGPTDGLIQATNGDLYGTTGAGGANPGFFGGGGGTIFRIAPSGTLTTLYSFCSLSGCTDGFGPNGELIQATNGYLYGITMYGGAGDDCSDTLSCGTVFKMTSSGTLTTLYSFCSESNCPDGAEPFDGLVRPPNGEFYGTTYAGGAYGYGSVFEITPSGTRTTLYSFCSQGQPCKDGFGPSAGLVRAANGDLYGTTSYDGANGNGGTVFKITPSGTLTTLYSFCSQAGCTDGLSPYARLVEATNGDLYGTTVFGGTNVLGTVFKITPSGTLTTLYSFCSQASCADGYYPYAELVQATDGNLYGTTEYGGANKQGTVFRITPSGTLTTLYSFCSESGCTDGGSPFGGLVQDTSGVLYGTTELGGASVTCYQGCGTIFRLSVGLGPFVETQTPSGSVGTAVKILGTGLTGATSVTFSGASAAFTVVSPSEIKTAVPAGATTGTVKVGTPSGTLSSNGPFRVLP